MLSRKAIVVDDAMIEEVEKLARRGLSQDEIARSLGHAPSWLYAKKKINNELMEAIKRGQAKGIRNVTNALYEKAIVGKNVAAQIFYLKNRAPDTWKEKIEQETSHQGEITIVYDDIDKKA